MLEWFTSDWYPFSLAASEHMRLDEGWKCDLDLDLAQCNCLAELFVYSCVTCICHCMIIWWTWLIIVISVNSHLQCT